MSAPSVTLVSYQTLSKSSVLFSHRRIRITCARISFHFFSITISFYHQYLLGFAAPEAISKFHFSALNITLIFDFTNLSTILS